MTSFCMSMSINPILIAQSRPVVETAIRPHNVHGNPECCRQCHEINMNSTDVRNNRPLSEIEKDWEDSQQDRKLVMASAKHRMLDK